MVLSRETQIYRLDARKGGELLTPKEREDLAKPYLPAPPSKPPPSNSSTRKPHRRRIRPFLKTQLHLLVYFLIHALFSLYIRLRQFTHAILSRALAILYYHHRTPELIRKDVKSLPRVPQHLSVILSLPPSNGAGPVGLEELLDDVAEIAAWSACVGIPMLSIYERTGVLQKYIPTTHRAVARKLQAYFGRRRPSLKVGAPHVGGFQNGDGVGEGEGVGDCGNS
jgi:dehydrodolichyl diphosphate syntase complex subunit NUS1